jgi:hypothetical protein
MVSTAHAAKSGVFLSKMRFFWKFDGTARGVSTAGGTPGRLIEPEILKAI